MKKTFLHAYCKCPLSLFFYRDDRVTIDNIEPNQLETHSIRKLKSLNYHTLKKNDVEK